MSIPGFTAHNSLYSRRNYVLTRVPICAMNSMIEPQLRVGGGGLSNKCDDNYGDCYIDCSLKYPESKDAPGNLNSMYRDACFDSCDAADNLCRRPLSIGRRNVLRARVGNLIRR